MNLRRIFNRITGQVQHFMSANHVPATYAERFTRLDPTDWADIDYFKDRDYCPQNVQLLGAYSLHAEFKNGLYDISLALRGDAASSALGPRGFTLIPGFNDFLEPIPSLTNLTRGETSALMRRFENGEPIASLAGAASSHSILDEICYGEATYGSYTRRHSSNDTERRAFYDAYAAHVKNWGFAERYLSNPYQDWHYHIDRQPKIAAPV